MKKYILFLILRKKTFDVSKMFLKSLVNFYSAYCSGLGALGVRDRGKFFA